jgi:S1-C subfamily serine protease
MTLRRNIPTRSMVTMTVTNVELKLMSRLKFSLAALAFALSVGTSAQENGWNQTLERISSGVVSIRVDSTRAFDTERNQSTQATGFVVDAEHGLILTNRHVVTPGPVRAQAIFLNQEEVDLIPVYRDPVHDFGFFRYDPEDLQFIEPAELPLVSEAPQVGREIRVVGNDAGEQLSILAGTIARLDRQAPNYGRGNYNDFNTFYYQAASGTSGGSSGSPVVDIDGRVVALNAGANTRAASSFFLPLDRVRVALDHIQHGEQVPRGTLQTEFVHTPFAELRRLGLAMETESAVRAAFPKQTGLLIVEQVLPGSAASALLRPGDVLLELNGKLISGFVPLAAILDDSVGQEVSIAVDRGGERIESKIVVDDLHRITPDEYLEYGDGIFHNLSYQQARHYYRSVEGVFVANPGYVFGTGAIPRASLVTEVGGSAIRDLDDLQEALLALPEGQQVSVRFLSFDDPRNERQRFITNNRAWYRTARCRQDDTLGYWPCEELGDAAVRETPRGDTITFPREGERHVQVIAPSLVLVNFSMPYTVSGVSDRYYYGTGVVADAGRGWVIVDRNTVPVAMGDVRLTFAGSLEIPGRVEYIHPLHNLAVVSYDTALLGDSPVKSAQFASYDFSPGDSVTVVGLSADHSLLSQTNAVARLSQVNFPLSRTLRFRDTNLDAVTLVNGPSDFDGVIVDRQGRVIALWASFAYESGRDTTQVNMGIPADIAADMIASLEAGEPLHSLEVEWRTMPLATVRKFDLPDIWARRYEEFDSSRRELLAVQSTVAGSPADAFLRSGDVLLAIDGEPVNTFRGIERATQKDSVEVTILRDGREFAAELDTVELDGIGIDRVVLWAGALLQMPHRALSAQRGIGPGGVYVSYFNFGSPASRSQLFAGRRVVAVDGVPTPDLDHFIGAVAAIEDGESVRLDTVTWNNVPEVITLKVDDQYWPSYELRREGHEWVRRPIG